jgi:predicted nucleotide-binding protein
LPLKQTVLAKFSEATFTRLAEKYAVLWRRIALDGAERLRERGRHVRPKNPKPRIFIGSSVEGLSITRAIQSCFSHDDFHLKPWTDGVFRATSTAIEDLLREVNQSDFAILVLTADDMVISREMEMKAPRDNCIFELGLFLGALGRERTVIVRPRGADIKIPTDLLGLMPLDFKDDGPDYLAANLGPSCDSIRKLVKEMGLR